VFQVYVDLANWDKLKEDDVEVKTVVGDLKYATSLIVFFQNSNAFLFK